ncbi:hypothetical protein E1B28_001975 [Marasmius oreades]|uniref:Uncharacterized protein n=1 Tax=Marasmius oreades TaxID=181124 RepID=A0A9P8AGF7_9AGAR|nr:uncharacterized protein E1B28_001975 [Marasmius oreades]KAG7100200.1 hypothetical protein E1B28_001975 [Marasmius oreades]
MATNEQLHAENVQGGRTTARRAEVRWLRQALVDGLNSANGEAFLSNLIEGALGALARAKVIDPDSLDPDNAPLKEDQEVAVLLCEAVYLFERSCARGSPPADPLAATIWNKARGEDLTKIVIDSGLKYLVSPSPLFRVQHQGHTPYQYFDSQLKKALGKALIELQSGDIKTEVEAAWRNANGAPA